MAEMSASSSVAASPYLFRDGRRIVAPYPHEFATHAKGRWIGRRVAEVLYEEFHTSAEWTPEYFASTSAAGRLTLNGRPATLEDSFKDGDRLVHVVLRVEPSVPATPIEVLLCDDQLLAVHKPAGVPVHHAGRYRKNSLIEILQSEHADLGLSGLSGNVHVLHRLDRQLGAPVPLNSTRGQRLLSECRGADRSAFEWLWPHFEQQRGPAMCGPASVAMVLRAVAACDGADAALRLATEALVSRAPTKKVQLTDEVLAAEGQLTEEVVLNGQMVLSPHKVRSSGLTLAEMGTLLEALSVPCALTHVRGIAGAAGSDVSAEAELAAARAAMAQLRLALHGAPRAAVLVNYHMGVAGHRPFGGHFSPLAAYHEETDRFLVLDCWPQTEPSWLASERLWSAMAATDAESRLSRGWARVGLGTE
eukprot:jgi/Chrpa1/14822/Chrysochromulina_OHIO_Genome00020895-RA